MRRTLEHCGLITRMGDKEHPPKVENGRCEGYQQGRYDDEPCDTCKECELNVWHED